jgi:hypothetical protein
VLPGDTRKPLLIAGIAAVATYLVLGASSPFDGMHLSSLHNRLFHHHREAADVHQAAADVDQAVADAHQAVADAHQVVADAHQAETDAHRSVSIEQGGLSGFSGIVLDTIMDVTVTIGDTPSVKVDESGDSMSGVRTSVHNGKLVINADRPGAHLTITMPHLYSLQVNGPGNVVLIGLRDPLSIVAHGPANFRATGTIDTLDLKLDGPSNLDLLKLEAKDVVIKMNGGGDADVHATRNLIAEVHGMGRVRYIGEPHTSTTIDGSGSIGPLPNAT